MLDKKERKVKSRNGKQLVYYDSKGGAGTEDELEKFAQIMVFGSSFKKMDSYLSQDLDHQENGQGQ